MELFDIIESKSQWDKLLNQFGEVDIYYTFEYGTLFSKEENGTLLAAYYEIDDAKVFYPFIKRKIDWKEEAVYDIVTPYGYGGPLLKGNDEKITLFYKSFEAYCKENNIITETIRFHPIYKNFEACREIMDVEYIRKTTAVNLIYPLEQIRKDYSSMNKRNIKKAQKEGVNCFLAPSTPENILTFIELYKETMDRNHAVSYYYFEDKYFYEQMKNTSVSETLLLFAKYQGEIIAGVMVLVGLKYSHYHLGASKTAYLHLKPNNLLFDFMIEICKSKGASLLHLGGGYQEDDGLFRFKSSFTNDYNFDYFLGKKVYDGKKYIQISDEVKKCYKVNEKFFPLYRGKQDIPVEA
jgi:hypothetical protein